MGSIGLPQYPRGFAKRDCKLSNVGSPGCGDAFRAGFLHAYLKGRDLEACCQLGSVMGSFAIERSGGQNHRPDKARIMARYEENFGVWPEPKSARRSP